ncbi:hypothetical protein [Streptomyces sp. OspMP-M43]|uniref:hypothetical protein n=1 Tax=Streptomyces sp. OspMP-M43 TaxID=1839781 RepID=UPI000B824ED3|nr:hypothetical protein [Streptomyces sp. OspMP-M43]
MASDAVDAVHRRAVGAVDEVLEAPYETRFRIGGLRPYVCTLQDPEVNLWTFATYRGPPLE